MSVEVFKTWKCDFCDVVVEKDGPSRPEGWVINISVNVEGAAIHHELRADFCPECWSKTFLYKNKDVPPGLFKNSWWRKFWTERGTP